MTTPEEKTALRHTILNNIMQPHQGQAWEIRVNGRPILGYKKKATFKTRGAAIQSIKMSITQQFLVYDLLVLRGHPRDGDVPPGIYQAAYNDAWQACKEIAEEWIERGIITFVRTQ